MQIPAELFNDKIIVLGDLVNPLFLASSIIANYPWASTALVQIEDQYYLREHNLYKLLAQLNNYDLLDYISTRLVWGRLSTAAKIKFTGTDGKRNAYALVYKNKTSLAFIKRIYCQADRPSLQRPNNQL